MASSGREKVGYDNVVVISKSIHQLPPPLPPPPPTGGPSVIITLINESLLGNKTHIEYQ